MILIVSRDLIVYSERSRPENVYHHYPARQIYLHKPGEEIMKIPWMRYPLQHQFLQLTSLIKFLSKVFHSQSILII